MATAAPKQKMYPHPYGLRFPEKYPIGEVEKYCFYVGHSGEEGLGRYQHAKNYATAVWPQVEWNPWLEKIGQELFSEANCTVSKNGAIVQCLSMTGCAAAGKTFSSIFWAMAWWRLDPENTAVILCSTSKAMASKRQWPTVVQLHRSACNPDTGELEVVGHMLDSRRILMAQKGDERHSISVIAVEEGGEEKAVNRIKGIHAQRVAVIVDEAESTPSAIMKAIANLRKGCKEFRLIVIGNSTSRLDPHGKCCEPDKGWSSVSPDDETWKTKGVVEWQVEPGLCLHFSGKFSPNVLEGRTIYPYLYTYEDWQAANKNPEYLESAYCWSHDFGFWAPDGISDRLFSEAMFDKYGARKELKFLTEAHPIAFLDPAFGGDQCKFVYGMFGGMAQMTDGVQIVRRMEIQVKATDKNERDYQIARTSIDLCKQFGVEPSHFGCDATGTGRGVHAIICGEWDASIQRVEFGNRASDRNSGTADHRPEHEVYNNYVTAMWFWVKEVLQCRQVGGFYDDAINQFCARPFRMNGRKYQLVPKRECPGRSPDDADAIAGLFEVARRLGWQAKSPITNQTDKEWNAVVKDTQTVTAGSIIDDESGAWEPKYKESNFMECSDLTL